MSAISQECRCGAGVLGESMDRHDVAAIKEFTEEHPKQCTAGLLPANQSDVRSLGCSDCTERFFGETQAEVAALLSGHRAAQHPRPDKKEAA